MLADGTIVELVHDPEARTTALAVGEPDGSTATAERLELPDGQVLVPYAPDNNLLTTGAVVLPSAIGRYEAKAELLADIKAFLHRHVDLSPLFEDIAAHYVLFSWVYDAFQEAPMLRLSGEFGSGKTRGLLAIGSLCHKAFFASGASTTSPIFHIIDAFGGTLALDEADLRLSDKTADLVKILNNGTTRGLPVLRTMTNRHKELNPTAFRVFGPKIVAMRGTFDDEALESRFIDEVMGTRPLRSDIPLATPESLRSEARSLRDRLLAWRFAERRTLAIDLSRAIEGLSPRGNQMALPLLALADDPGLREALGGHLARQEARAQARRAERPRAKVAGVLDRMFRESGASAIPVARVAEEYNRDAMTALPVKSVGHIVRAELGLETRKSRGVYVVPADERTKIAQVAARHRIDGVGAHSAAAFIPREAREK
ncbi:MAG TPA: hypothetical protein VEB68_10470 [Croceibacterium sp.]|nr:hypothetical protein [Croceibacterium sp.]